MEALLGCLAGIALAAFWVWLWFHTFNRVRGVVGKQKLG
jgi:hypothetical protein